MNSPKATILIVEDDPGVALLERRHLERAGFATLVAGTPREAMQAIQNGSIDLILLDYRLPGDMDGLEFHGEIKAAGCNLPVIMVTGFGNEAAAIDAFRAGIRDFVAKSSQFLDYLPEAVERVLRQVRTEHQLAESEARLAGIVNSAMDAILTVEADETISMFNPAAEQMFRCRAASAVGQPLARFIPRRFRALADAQEGAVEQSGEESLSISVCSQTRGFRADGEEFPLEVSVSRVEVGVRKFYTLVVRDITERLRVQEALRASEQRYRSIVETANEGIWILDAGGRTTYSNQQMAGMLGSSMEDIRGRLLEEFVLDEDRPAIRDWVERCRHGAREQLDFRLRTRAGRVCWALASCNAIRGNNGQIQGILAMVTDVTKRKQAEERIREQAALLDRATDAILECDLDDRILFWNQGAERLYGWTAAEALGRRTADLLFDEPSLELEQAMLRVLDQGEWTGELQQVTRREKKVTVQSRWTLVREADGRPRSRLVINTDITDKKNLDAQLLRTQRLESIGTLAGGIAHDLNNVLTPISMAIELIRMKLPDPDSQSLLNIVEASVQRGADMVKQVLSFARGVEGQRQVLLLPPLVHEIGKMLSQTFPKSIQVHVQVPKDLWAITAEATQMHQILMNLSVNARDAMPHGGILTIAGRNTHLDEQYARMNVEARPGPYVVLMVEDTGSGIPPGIIDRIFDPFFTTKELGKGTGLGLSTVLGIVKSHGGFVHVYSEVGKGTQFSVYLPALESSKSARSEPLHAEIPLGQGELILVVDDETGIREITKVTLEASNYQVLTARDGTEAIALFAQFRNEIELVITDMMMPIMDGPATIRALQKLDPHVRIIAASGLLGSVQVTTDREVNVKAYLQKPFTAETLLRAVHEALHG